MFIINRFYFFQELDDVYHESSSVVAETLVQGADVMSLKVRYFLIFPLDGARVVFSPTAFPVVPSVIPTCIFFFCFYSTNFFVSFFTVSRNGPKV